MLTELRIQDLAVIERLAVRLEPGLNVLTGETGAGKSIVVGALSLLLGERASADVVRAGTARAIVEGVFEVGTASDVRGILAEQGIDLEDDIVILRREVAAEGRNRAWINGAASTAGLVGRIGARLIDLHGQSEHDDLVRPERQRHILDAFGNALELTERVRAAWADVRAAQAAIAEFDEQRSHLERQVEALRHTAIEIERAGLRAGEEQELEAEASRLDHAGELTRLAARLHDALYASEHSIAARLDDVRRTLAHLLRIDPDATDAAPGLDDAFFLVEELGRQMADYGSRIESDPVRLDAIRTRQDLLFRLKARYGETLEDVIAAGLAARAQLERLESGGLDRDMLLQRLSERVAAHGTLCAELSAVRVRAAARLAERMAALLPSLGLDGGRFEVALDALREPGSSGAESVEFRVALNAGFDPRPVSRVASGGELSRLMLALKTILADADATPTLAFDEIDAGVGGRVAHAVADKLRAVSRTRQVFVVTHLAQIAARADHHLLVEKAVHRGKTATMVRELDGQERVHELARLLGGDPESAISLEHARELLAATGA